MLISKSKSGRCGKKELNNKRRECLRGDMAVLNEAGYSLVLDSASWDLAPVSRFNA